jgi:hypothetical protein
MKKIVLTLGLSAMFLAGACGDGSDKLSALKDKMCACKDAACATELTKELAGLEGEVKETEGNKKLLNEIMACATKAAAGGAGAPAAPAAEK